MCAKRTKTRGLRLAVLHTQEVSKIIFNSDYCCCSILNVLERYLMDTKSPARVAGVSVPTFTPRCQYFWVAAKGVILKKGFDNNS